MDDRVLETEREPLVKRKDFRSLSQPAAAPVVVKCCCVESTRLGRVPVIRTLFKKKEPSERVCKYRKVIIGDNRIVAFFFPPPGNFFVFFWSAALHAGIGGRNWKYMEIS